MSATQTAELAGETVTLLPERALYWPRRAALLIADLHLGKDATFRASGVPLPGGTTAADLARLSVALERSGARRLVILGDFFHARRGRDPALLAEVAAWRAAHADLEIVLVRGNHDRSAGDPPPEWRIAAHAAPLADPPFALCHEPAPQPGSYALAGHIHPLAALRGPAGSLRLPCFWLGAHVGVLPAFSQFTAGQTIGPARGDQVFVIAEQRVMAVGQPPR